jgi:FkbH-like protein
MQELEYPFDSEYILKKKKKIKRELLEGNTSFLNKKIAVLGGSTTSDVVQILDLFLLNLGIRAEFYESEYGLYWEDAMFGNEALEAFKPDLIYVHTSNHNINEYPLLSSTREDVDRMIANTYNHFEQMWDKLNEKYHCPVIQNNFEYPAYRILGNKEAYDYRGKINFINRLNDMFYQYADTHNNFYIQDIQYMSACYGVDKWSDDFYWHMYKYALAVPAIPDLAFNLSNIIKSIYGKNKKAIVLDLDNTLWGGIVGDDGVEKIEIGQETSNGQVFQAFQKYLKECASIGVMLNVNSKNDYDNAIAGLNHPEGVLRPEDFIIIKANWEPKSKNIMDIATELNIMPDSLVFVDDNPSEREIVRQLQCGISVPEIGTPDQYIKVLDRSGFFEVTSLSSDDMNRNEMYKSNLQRQKQQASYTDYNDYLISLEMKAVIKPFEDIYMARIAQLTNKSNQFNLTTKRYSQSEIEETALDRDYITLYGKLEDKFGDNGVVSVVIGHIAENICHIDLWIMSCRVLKRDMECAMFDALVAKCQEAYIREIRGYYYPTAKNKMVRGFYLERGFDKIEEDEQDNTVWRYIIPEQYDNQNKVIKVEA